MRCRCDHGPDLEVDLPETHPNRRADRRDTTIPAGSRPVVLDHPRCAEIPTHQESGRSPYATWMPYASRGWSKMRPYHKRAPGGAERQRELKINVRVCNTKERYAAAGTSPGSGGPFGAALVTRAV